MNIGDLFWSFRGDGARLQADAKTEGAKAGQTLGQSMAAGIKANSTKALTGAGAGIGAFVAGSTQEFAKFEQSMNEVFTLLPDITSDAMGKMSADVEAFARETGKLPEDVIPALYQAISAGVPPDNVFDFLRTANKNAVGGVTDLTTSVDGLSSVVNAYGKGVLSVDKASDIMFTGVRLGKTTIGELSKSLFNVVPTASALGVSFGDVTAALAAMTAQGVPTAVATTQLRQLFVELSKEGSATAVVFEKIAGKSFKQFIAEGGNVQQALQLMETHAKTSGLGINDLFSSVEAGNAALALTGKGTETFAANLDAMGKSAGATDKAFATMDQGIAATTRKIAATIRTFAIDVGRQLQDLGPIFVLFGPAAGRAIGAGLGAGLGFAASKLGPGLAKMWAVASGSSVVKGAIARAGSAGATVYLRGLMAGDAISGALSSGIGKVAKSSLVTKALEGVGKVWGSVLGKATVLGFAAVVIVELMDQLQKLHAENDAQVNAIGVSIGKELAAGQIEGLRQSKGALEKAISDLNGPLMVTRGLNANEINALQAQLDLVNGVLKASTDAAAADFRAGEKDIGGSTDKIVTHFKSLAPGAARAFGKVGDKSTTMADKIKADAALIKGFVSSLTNFLIGEVTRLIDGYYDPIIAQDQLKVDKDTVAADTVARNATKAGSAARHEADLTLANSQKNLDETRANLLASGTLSAKEQKVWLDELKKKYKTATGSAKTDIGELIKKVEALGHLQSVGLSIDVVAKLTHHKAAGGPVVAGQPYIVGENRPELFVPSVNGTIIPRVPSLGSAAMAGAAGNTYISLTLPAKVAPDPFETAHQLQRIADFHR